MCIVYLCVCVFIWLGNGNCNITSIDVLNYAQHMETCTRVHGAPNVLPHINRAWVVPCCTWINDWISNHNKIGECSLWGLCTHTHFGCGYLFALVLFNSIRMHFLFNALLHPMLPVFSVLFHITAHIVRSCVATWIILIVWFGSNKLYSIVNDRFWFSFGSPFFCSVFVFIFVFFLLQLLDRAFTIWNSFL